MHKQLKKKDSPHSPKQQKPPAKSKKSNNILGFYLKSLLLAILSFMACYFIFIHGYVDMQEAQKIANRIREGDPKVTIKEKKLLQAAQAYEKSSNYHWLHHYKWVYHYLVRSHLDLIESLGSISIEEKYKSRSGSDYQYLQYIKNNTPEDAVILMPDLADLEIPKDAPAGTPQLERVANKAWATYFLYPRKLVYDQLDGQDYLADGQPNIYKSPGYQEERKKLTHVAIVYGRGYEHLSYPVQKRLYYAVMPIQQDASQPRVPQNP